MKTNKSFGARIQEVFAALMRGIAPRYCVKKLTLKSNPTAYRYLPGSEKELSIIREMGDKADKSFLQARCWSLETRVALLSEGNDALVNDVRTNEEFMAVYALDNLKLMTAVMRVYTPDRKCMLKMLSEKEVTLVAELAKRVPAAFASLTAREILGVKDGAKLQMDSPRWGIASSLAQAEPRWNVAFLRELMIDGSGSQDKLAQNHFRYYFSNAVQKGEDIHDFMRFVHSAYPDLDELVREAKDDYKYFLQCFIALFPRLVNSLMKSDSYALWNACSVSKASCAAQWLYAALSSGCKEIVGFLVHRLSQLFSVLSEDNANYLLAFLCNHARDAYEINELLCFVKGETLHTMRQKLVVNSAKSAELINRHFPFVDWRVETAKKAIAFLVLEKKFPVDRMSELSPELKQYAVAEMECYSQIKAIRMGKANDLVAMMRLHPQAERELLMHSSRESICTYVQHFKLHESSFSYLLNMTQFSATEMLICVYAEKWGLTEKQYYELMQSNYRSQAPFLAKYITE